MRSLRCVFKSAQLVWFTGFSADVVPVGAADKTLMSYVSAPLYSTSLGPARWVIHRCSTSSGKRLTLRALRLMEMAILQLCARARLRCVTEYARHHDRRGGLVGLPLDSARPLTFISWYRCWPLSAVRSSCGALIVLIIE